MDAGLGERLRWIGRHESQLDWSSIGASGPLYTPYWALGNYFGGLVGMLWVVRARQSCRSSVVLIGTQILPIMLAFNFW